MKLVEFVSFINDLRDSYGWEIMEDSISKNYEMRIIVDSDDKTFNDDLVVFADHHNKTVWFVSGLTIPFQRWFEMYFSWSDKHIEFLFTGDEFPDNVVKESL